MSQEPDKGLEAHVAEGALYVGDVRVYSGDLHEDLDELTAFVTGDVYATESCRKLAACRGTVYGTQRAKTARAMSVDGTQRARKAKAVNVDGRQLAFTAEADYLHGEQTAFLATAIEPESDGVQKGFLLWGPGNRDYNPSIGYQKLDGVNEDLGLCPTFRKAYNTVKDYLS